jgi:hypothetical protein
MVAQCLENNGTDPLTCSCRWMHEGADLRWYVWGCVRRGTAHQKHNATWLVRAFSGLTDEDRKVLTLGLLFLVVIQERCLRTHTWWRIWTLVRTYQKHEKPPSTSLFLVPRAVVTVHFDTLCSTRRTCSCSQHESFCTSLRKYVVPAHSDWTPDCPAPFTTPHSHFLLFLPPFFKAQEGFIKHWFVVFTEFYCTEKK